MEAAGLRRHPAHVPARSAPPRPSGSPRSRARRASRSSATRPPSSRGLSPALAAAGAEVGFLVEVDTGFQRTGVQTPADAAELAELADSLPGLRFDGLMTYPTLPGHRRRSCAPRSTRSRRAASRSRTVSAGGTPTFFTNHEVPEVTEVRAGTYVYGDRSCIANGSVPLEDCALRVRATVVSRPTADRGDPRRRLEDADERPGRGGRRRRPRPRRRVPRRADLRAVGGARARRRLPPAPTGPRSARSSRSSRTTRAAARTCTTRSSSTAAAASSASGRSPPAASSADPDDEGEP